MKLGHINPRCTIPANFLNTGVYYITVLLVGENFNIITELEKIIKLKPLKTLRAEVVI